jgi:hypothetical protein
MYMYKYICLGKERKEHLNYLWMCAYVCLGVIGVMMWNFYYGTWYLGMSEDLKPCLGSFGRNFFHLAAICFIWRTRLDHLASAQESSLFSQILY